MKYFIFILVFMFSAPAFSYIDKTRDQENNLSPEQKLTLNMIYYEIDIEYSNKNEQNVENSFDLIKYEEELNKASIEIDLIISSVISFGEKIKAPINTFLETDLAFYIGVIVAVNFFGENIFSLFNIFITFFIMFSGLMITNKMSKINNGVIKDFNGYSIRHGNYTYQEVVKVDTVFPVFYYISLIVFFVWMIARII